MDTDKLTQEAAEAYASRLTFDNPRLSSDQIYASCEESKKDFTSGAEWERSRDKWVSVDVQHPAVHKVVDILANGELQGIATLTTTQWIVRSIGWTFDPSDDIVTHWKYRAAPPESLTDKK